MSEKYILALIGAFTLLNTISIIAILICLGDEKDENN